MYINHEERKAKIGKVSVSVKRDTIRLRFTHPKEQRNEINIANNTIVILNDTRESIVLI